MTRLAANLLATVTLVSSSVLAATPAQEKAFLDAYQKALEAGDDKALESFFYTEPQGEPHEFLKRMYLLQSGDKVTKIELREISAADAEKLTTPLEMPDGKSYLLSLQPTKILVVETKSGGSTVTNRLPVAEKDGKLVMPIPVLVKKK